MSLFKNHNDHEHVPALVTTRPPTMEELHAEASGTSAYARTAFTDVIEDLLEANDGFDAVEMRATAEIARLTELVEDARTQRSKNTATVQALQGLVGN